MTASGQVVIDEQNPWPGLGSFDESAERFFNGRSNEIAELRRLVLNAPLTILFGGSGLGKTSLVQAGLFPVLRKERILPVYVRLDVSDRQAPIIDQVQHAFEAQLRDWRVDAPGLARGEDLWRYLHRAGLELWSVQNQLLTPLFVFDQFEEVFTLGAANQAAIAQFQTDLADLVENRIPAAMAQTIQQSESAAAAFSLDRQRYKILISFRSDFLPAMERWKRKLPSIMRNRFQLLPMSGAQAFQAVHDTAPAIAGEDIARRIVDFVAATQQNEIGRTAEAMNDTDDVQIEPALLSLVCHGLNQKRKAEQKAAFDQELLDRSASSIIANYYLDSVRDMPDEVQQFIENQLITERGFRKPCDIDDARSLYHVTDDQLQTLVARRLLRIDPQRNTERVELTHDLLTRVVREHRDRAREVARLKQREEEDKALAKARRRRFQAFGFGVGGVVLAALVVLFAWMYQRAQRQATLATAGRLAASAVVTRESELDLAALLSVEARRLAPDTLETRNAALVTFQTNPRLITYLHHPGSVQGAAISPDGARLATAGADGLIRFWDLAAKAQTGDPLKGHDGEVNAVCFSPDGKLLASAGADGTVRLWDVAARRVVGGALKGHTDEVNAIAFSPDGSTLVSGSLDKTVRLWEVLNRTPIATVLSTAGFVWAVAFSPDGKLLAAAGDDHTIHFVDPPTRQPKGADLHVQDTVYSLAFSPDGNTLASGQADGTVRLWDAKSRTLIGEPLRGHQDYASSVAFTRDGKVLASGSYDRTIRLWDVATREPFNAPFTGHGSFIYTVAFTPDGKMLASASFDQDVILWDVSGHESVSQSLHGHTATVESVAFSPDARNLASAGDDGTIWFWEIQSRAASGDPVHTSLPFDSVAFSPDGKMFVTAGKGGPRIWLTSTRKVIAILAGCKSEVSSIAWSGEGIIAWNCADDGIHEYDAGNRREVLPVFGDGRSITSNVAIGQHGTLVAAAYMDGGIRLWDAAAGRLLATLTGHEQQVTSVTFSPDGRLLASSGYDQTVRLWDVAARSRVGKPMRGSGPMFAVAFSADGKLLASGSQDSTVRLWDVDSQLPFGDPFKGHWGTVTSVAFSPDGKWAASGAADKTVRLWQITLDAWAARSCSLANRNLSLAEWRQYVGAGVPYRRTCPNLPPGEGAGRD